MKPESALAIYRQMLTIRAFEQKILDAHQNRLVHGAAHTYIGMEAVAVGICAALTDDDYVTSTHRGHGHCIARGLDVKRMLAEIYGRATGYCKGKGGSMHLADVSRGMLGADGIVGGGIPIAVGAALGCRVQGLSRIVVSFFGEGASNEGSFHEGLNLAAVQKLPVIFVCENNHWALSAGFEATTSVANVSDRASSYSMPGHLVDGNNVEDVLETAVQAVQHANAGNGPSLIECNTYRWEPHSIFTLNDVRPREEIEAWKLKDPIARYRALLTERGWLTEESDAQIQAEVNLLLDEAEQFASDSPFPAAEEAMTDVYA